MAQINTRIVLRNDSKANWDAVKDTATLMVGEMGVETDTGLFKIGKEKSAGVLCTWAELEYANEIPEIDLSTVENNVIVVDAFSKLPTEGNVVGDIGIVKELIFDDTTEDNKDLYSYTSYVWGPVADGFAWTAMDGNYNASNVYFDKDLTYTTTVGALKLASGKNSDTYAAKGKSLETVIRRIMAETIAPTITQPSYSMSANYTADNGTEVGSKITALKWDGNFSDGSYSYGRATAADGTGATTTKAAGCTATYSVDCDKAGATTTPTAVDGTWTLTTPFQITGETEATVGTMSTSCVISDAKYWPINNINEVVDGKITGKTVDKTSTVKVTGYRGWFCGWKNGTDALANPTAITSDQVRALTKANGSWSSSMDVSQMKQMFFLAPAGRGYKPVIKDSKTDAPQTVEGPVTVYVKGANNYVAAGDETTNGGMAYDMWYVNNAAAASGSATLNITKA